MNWIGMANRNDTLPVRPQWAWSKKQLAWPKAAEHLRGIVAVFRTDVQMGDSTEQAWTEHSDEDTPLTEKLSDVLGRSPGWLGFKPDQIGLDFGGCQLQAGHLGDGLGQ